MEKFIDVVKIDFDENIEKYFREVLVESIKKSEAHNTLNFYLVSYDIIPYNYIKLAKKTMAEQMFNLKDDAEYVNPINFIIKYKLSDKYTIKSIYEAIRKDIFEELKESNILAATFFRNDKIVFLDDDTMEITFRESKEFKSKQEELVEIIKNIFKNRYEKDIKIEVKYEVISTVCDDEVNDKAEYHTEVSNEGSVEKKDAVEEKPHSDRYLKRGQRRTIHDEGDILFGNRGRNKHKFVTIADMLYDMDGIETTGVIYDLKYKKPENKDFVIYILYIYDGESCIAVKFYGNVEDIDKFRERFKVGLDIRVYGNVKYDSWDKAMVIGPQGLTCIEVIGRRDVIEFNKLGDEDYHNIFITEREDNEAEKRVELHLHTKSSTQDGVGEIKAYIDTATKFGMQALAITDHGCVNALADAYGYMSDKKRPRKDKYLKIINGVEGYLVEDFENYYIDKDNKFSTRPYAINDEFVIYEFARTGNNRKNDDIIAIVAVKIKDFSVVGSFKEYVHVNRPLNVAIKDNTGVKEKDIENAGSLKDALTKLKSFARDSVYVTKNIESNWLLSDILKENDIDNDICVLDLTVLSRLLLSKIKKGDLVSIAKELKIKKEGLTDRKRGEAKKNLTPMDKLALEGPILCSLLTILKTEKNISDLSMLKDKLVATEEFIRRQPYYHIILLAKNDVGRVNLYKLVSDSSVNYMYNKRPRMPRSLISKYREGLIVGSACILGEFMDAIKDGASDDKLKSIAEFYDYLEIQPILNNSFLLNEDKENFKTLTDLENLNKTVVRIGDEIGKPVVATCDCHYVNKEDKIFRSILRFGATDKKSNYDSSGNLKLEVSETIESSNNEELYFRTTKEMLDEFSYLGVDKAKEVVITNTNLINSMIEDVLPLRLDKCPPYIEGSEDELKDTCYKNYNKIFGDNNIPEIKDRLDDELKYIIDNGYSVMYIAAKKLIDYSIENGYPVGSRGSVGSSLAATLLGVSEVNPLKPYYICPRCHHLEYDTEETKKYDNDTGFDMPDKNCPKCGTKMNKDGVNIPFETFLGIPGVPAAQKEPDIDLNFCSVFQSNIHKKTKDMFGEENTFKAGTVGTVADKTAYGYVKKYEEQEQKTFSKEQENYYAKMILDCKTNTGQHPGGMIVLPKGEEIYTFTPIQLAADKIGNDITTHFDYHKIDKNLLKLDLLGQTSPLMLKKLAEMTGVDYNSVPFYEEDVLRLFKDTKSLGIEPSDISGTRLGCLTIPEFGTDIAISMCEDAKPQTVADLIRISGLAHGTDVWRGNVQDLIKNGDCTLSSAICCRDDIMIYLIDKGLDKGLAFNIMESVRKGKGLNGEWEGKMREVGVPDWYIGCCKKIKYMFPKAHATAYVLASLRIAYYKLHYPREYYATYFSIKKDGINYKYMMQDKEDITYHIIKTKKIIDTRKNSRFNKYNEENEIEDKNSAQDSDMSNIISKYESMSTKNLEDLNMMYRVVEEMKARGIDFCPIDIYKSKRSDFQVINGRVMPSFDSIPGIGVKDDIDYDDTVSYDLKSTAMKCEIEGRKKEYNSIEDFRKRTGVDKTIIEEMKSLKLFGDLKDSDENTIFDYIN